MTRFTLKDLLAAMGLVAVGLAMVLVSLSPILERSGWRAAAPMGFWYVGAACVGAGVLAPFKMARTGVWIALFAACIYDLQG